MSSQDRPPPPAPQTDATEGKTPPKEAAAGPRPRRWRRRLRTCGIICLFLVVLGGAGLGGAEYYTAQPDFCGSCHIMDPYYESWSGDVHGGNLEVKCVECHYAPGEQHTVMAKFRGLSQAASYFSGRSGKSRPRAHVADASCLTSRCHGDGAYRDTVLTIGEQRFETRIVSGESVEVERRPTVRFVHSKHMAVDERLAETSASIEALKVGLRARLPGEAYARITGASQSVAPSAVRESRMIELLRALGQEDESDGAMELMRLEHTRLRLAQLRGLDCAACHTYDAAGTHHFSVNHQTCFTCHFTHQAFNRDTGECLKCHEPPARMIAVHSQPPGPAGAGAFPATTVATATLMDHRDIVSRGIDCASCHFDVIRGSAEVSARDCTHCHDQARYVAEFDGRTTETVEMYHRVHVAAQHAQCTDCHRAVGHGLIDPHQQEPERGFLRPVLDDCQHCHPRHHREQVALLTGTGGVGPARPMPNAMFGSRLNCRACHKQPGSDFKGDPLVKATEATCVACHSEDYRTLFQQWQAELGTYQEQARAALGRVEARIAALHGVGKTAPAEVEARLSAARENLQLVEAGNGIHNKNYALQLLDICIRDVDEAMVLLSK